MTSDLGILAVSWIAGLALSWALAVLRSQRIEFAVVLCAMLAYGFSPVIFDGIRIAIVVAALVVLATRVPFEEIDRAYGDAARSLGASEWRLAARLLPLAGPRILTALVITVFLTLVAA